MPTASSKKKDMHLSQKGVEFIAGFEGFRSHLYNDPAGHATIGFGHLLHRGHWTFEDKRKWGKGLTRKQGLELLRKDAVTAETIVNRRVTVPLTQAQFDALVSFAFNVGPFAFASSTLLKRLNAEKRHAAADEFLRWDKADGKRLAGLTRRRKAERAMFLTGRDVTKPKPKSKVPFQHGPSKSFTWQEVHRGRKPFGPVQRANAIRHARKLEKLKEEVNKRRAQHGLKPTALNILSWYRPEWYNTQIGGARKSQHIKALATDISLQEIDRIMPWRGGRLEFDRVAGKLFATDGFGQYPGGSRHVDSRGYRARWSSWSR